MNEKQMQQLADTPLVGPLEWIDRYANAVAEQLPPHRSNDIRREVRSLLLDEVEQVAPAGAPTEAQVIEVLERYPGPAEMAQRYGATTALIGPALYRGYLQTLKLVVTIVFWLSVIGEIFDAATGPGNFAPLSAIWDTAAALFISAGIVTLVFAIVERRLPAADLARGDGAGDVPRQRAWSVKGLAPVQDPNRVSLSDSFTSIVTALISVLFLAFVMAREGAIPIYMGGEWLSFAVLSDAALTALPWLVLLWSVELLVYIGVLALRRWTTVLRLVVLASQIASLGILLWLLAAAQITTIAPAEWIVRVIVIVMAVVTASEAFSQIWALARQVRRGPPSAVLMVNGK